jgi:hypothetical protein
MSVSALMDSPLWLAAGWTMIHLAWVGGLIGLAAALGRRLLRGARPEWRYAGSLTFLLALAAAPLVIFACVFEPEPRQANAGRGWILPAAPRPPQAVAPPPRTSEQVGPPLPAPQTEAERRPAWRSGLDELAVGLPWGWLAGAPLTFGLLATGLVGAERLRRQSRLLADGAVPFLCERLAGSLGLARRVAVAVCDRLTSPV